MAPSHLVTEPVYQQLNFRLREMIAKGEFTQGQKFLTEREICERFNISRPTANKAVSNFVAEGILMFKKGVGTFVRHGLLDYDLAKLVSFTDKARAARLKPSTNVLAFERVKASDACKEIRSRLDASWDDDLYWIERLRLADRAPVILERRYVIAVYCPGLTKKELAGSLYRLWSGKYRLDIAGANQTIRAVRMSGAESRLLNVRPGSPGLLVESLGFLRGDKPLWWEKTLYRGDRYEFHNRLGPVSTASPAIGKIIRQSKEK